MAAKAAWFLPQAPGPGCHLLLLVCEPSVLLGGQGRGFRLFAWAEAGSRDAVWIPGGERWCPPTSHKGKLRSHVTLTDSYCASGGLLVCAPGSPVCQQGGLHWPWPVDEETEALVESDLPKVPWIPLLLASPVQEPSSGPPLTSGGGEPGTHQPGVLRHRSLSLEGIGSRRPVDRFPKIQQVPLLWAGIMLHS